MKSRLEASEKIKKYNAGKILESIEGLPKQGFQALAEVSKIKFPKSFFSVNKVVVAGMGGSTIGTDLIRKALADKARVFIDIINDYRLPAYADKKTLVIASSYSGNTEEVVSAAKESLRKKLPFFIITTGGALASLAKKHRLPAYIFEPVHNPSNQPRMGLGYSIISQLELFRRIRAVNIPREEILQALKEVQKSLRLSGGKNLALKTAKMIFGKTPVFFSSPYFSGNGHILANQINENAKNLAAYYSFPELNHHLLEGLTHPEGMKKFVFILLESFLDRPEIKKRQQATKKILIRKKLKFFTLNLPGRDIFSQALWLVAFGGYLSFYLAVLNREKPHLIPWVDFLKKELAK